MIQLAKGITEAEVSEAFPGIDANMAEEAPPFLQAAQAAQAAHGTGRTGTAAGTTVEALATDPRFHLLLLTVSKKI